MIPIVENVGDFIFEVLPVFRVIDGVSFVIHDRQLPYLPDNSVRGPKRGPSVLGCTGTKNVPL